MAPIAALGAVLILLFLYYQSWLTPSTFGFYNDDAIYLTTAKALATGQGYRIISLPYEPAQTKYPPFYPFLLSLVWRLKPDFPSNLTAMMLVTVFSSIIAAAVAWVYISKFRYASKWTALIAVGLAAINLQTRSYTTGIYAEMTFAALCTLALLLAEMYEGRARAPALGLALGVVMGLAFLTRVNAVSLIIAVALYFGLARRWRRLLLSVGVASLFVLSWGIWTHVNRTTHFETNAIFMTDYGRFYWNVIRNTADIEHRSIPAVALGTIEGSVAALLQEVPAEVAGSYTRWAPASVADTDGLTMRGILAVTLIMIAVGMRFSQRGKWRLLPIYLITFLAVMLPLPPGESVYPRYILPILPFLMVFLLTGLGGSAKALWRCLTGSRGSGWKLIAGLATAPLMAILIFILMSYGLSAYSSVRYSKAATGAGVGRFGIEAEGFKWIEANTPQSAVVASIYHPMYYLYTGRKAVLCFSTGDAYPPVSGPDMQRILEDSGATYLALAQDDIKNRIGGPDYASEVTQLENKGLLEQLYKSPRGRMNIYMYKGSGESPGPQSLPDH
ncbi:MAG TPA: hypothetical protein VLZ81_11570 [Blastocatellia bacterium]|nr:hypothetical protein [Blastocatellia bacterium]